MVENNYKRGAAKRMAKYTPEERSRVMADKARTRMSRLTVEQRKAIARTMVDARAAKRKKAKV